MIIRLKATNDPNGNPRRCYVLFNPDGRPMAAWDEGYYGSDAVPGELRQQAYDAPIIHVPVREYLNWLAQLPSPRYYDAQYYGSPYQLQQALTAGHLS
jgi:hypothetical protein